MKMEKFECYDCGHKFSIPEWKMKYIDGRGCPKCDGRLLHLGNQMLAFAGGTYSHPGGAALVGEEEYELDQTGNRWAALAAGVYDLPKGTKVFTHDESRRLVQAIHKTD